MALKKILTQGFLVCLAICSFYFSVKQKVNIVFIGDSITEGEDPAKAPPAITSNVLENQMGFGKINFSNQGVSGCTTVDFLPSTATHFKDVVKAADNLYADKQIPLIFSIMLGTNDSAIEGPLGSPVAAEDYGGNMKIIIDSLLKLYPDSRVVIHYPIWYSPTTYNRSKYLQEGLTRLQSYLPVIDALVKQYAETNPGHVFTGDKNAFGYFKANHLTHMLHENGQQGIFYLHPNEKGSAQLARFWSKAIAKVAGIKNKNIAGAGFQFPETGILSADTLTTVSTFENISLYWKPAEGDVAREALIDGGITTINTNHERNAVFAVPQFDMAAPVRHRGLVAGSPGQDRGAVRLPNFNDHFKGKAPDMGAVEK